MKKSTLHHMAMYQNVLAVVKDHQSSWNTNPAITSVISQFESLLNNLNNRLNAQNTLTLGIRLSKETFISQLIDRMCILKKGLFLHAVQINDLTLRARHKESKSKLESFADDRLQVVCSSLLEDVDQYETELVALGVDPALIQAFRDQTAEYEERKNSVRQAIIERSLETKSIKELEKQLNKLLIEQLDRFISLFQSSNNPFFVTYKAARRIIGKSGPGSSKNDLKSA
ncbi:hypothetical protein [Fluviicola chungangensis]|uniref:Uncharacterized protein n=1 Tax=Fluviicola chungangensis TaxID=2597671 RepID=A0A556MYM8_9FLAO|nr:hypothetical protein [Fluviicola chungangensis]TSJ44889.1 hypothetical protein FO442_09840 [Fluviicola chungangensis]